MMKTKNVETTQARNLIAEKTTITGNIQTVGDIRIDGVINGDIEVKGRLVLGIAGKIKGNVTATESEVAGNLIGDIKVAEMLTVKASARIEGLVHIAKLLVEPGAVFNGKCIMGKQETPQDSHHKNKK